MNYRIFIWAKDYSIHLFYLSLIALYVVFR
jgi:hypothetical protein